MRNLISKKRNTHSRINRTSAAVILLAATLLFFHATALGQEGIGNEAVRSFWSESENILVFHPDLVRDIFFGISDLKGNPVTARRNLNREVLDCRFTSQRTSNCWIDQLKDAKKQRNLKTLFRVPVNIEGISKKVYHRDRKQALVTFTWNRPVFQPPSITIEEFLGHVGAASESKYYSVKSSLDTILLNPVFQNEIEILVTQNQAANLLDLYQRPPADYNDSVSFQYDSVYLTESSGTAIFNIYLKAVRLKVNHQTFRVNRDLSL